MNSSPLRYVCEVLNGVLKLRKKHWNVSSRLYYYEYFFQVCSDAALCNIGSTQSKTNEILTTTLILMNNHECRPN